MSMKSPFRAGVKKVKRIAEDEENKTKKRMQMNFAHQRYPNPEGSADYGTAKMKNELN